jgi:hypothetical protein
MLFWISVYCIMQWNLWNNAPGTSQKFSWEKKLGTRWGVVTGSDVVCRENEKLNTVLWWLTEQAAAWDGHPPACYCIILSRSQHHQPSTGRKPDARPGACTCSQHFASVVCWCQSSRGAVETCWKRHATGRQLLWIIVMGYQKCCHAVSQ